MSTHNIGSNEHPQHRFLCEAILMSTHNIGFYEDLKKIIFELSLNTDLISPADNLGDTMDGIKGNKFKDTKHVYKFKTCKTDFYFQ